MICYTGDHGDTATLPGTALDADPRFPFFGMSEELEAVAPGQGRRIDAYLQMKTCDSEKLRGKILIDSPGFDADAQRDAVLRIVDHIVDLSDLVIVMFDARRPEPGAMRDTLDLLVARTANRADPAKFLFVLNQLDTAAREDNPEEIVAAWQRCLAGKSMTTGRFYTIYNPDLAVEFPSEDQRVRFEARRDKDLAAIHERIDKVEVSRGYRIVASLRKTATDFSERAVPLLQTAVSRWRRRTLAADAVIIVLLVTMFLIWSIGAGHWKGLSYEPQWLEHLRGISWGVEGPELLIVLLLIAAHFNVRRLAAKSLRPWLRKQVAGQDLPGDLLSAFDRNTRAWRTIVTGAPAGWCSWARSKVAKVLDDCETYVQTLNQRFTNPREIREPDAPGPGSGGDVA